MVKELKHYESNKETLFEKEETKWKQMKKITVTATATLFIATLAFTSISAFAGEVSINKSSPMSGAVVLDDNGKVISANDTSFISKNKSIQSYGITWVEDGQWVYGSLGYPQVAWGKKGSFSNFLHKKRLHSATAKVGSKSSGRVYAEAGKWACAKVVANSGEGQAQAFYNIY
ncbi:Bacteriocin (Lactococcin_972) [Pilibacter termitis]|uniref:Bacteriocin (Lactococcin_972) n=1 Tax=Pilibacter termitis TaxID=263852 RepID=A0A1T4LAN3_9ENTE|nr:lactococcin 972 family bacteriocin [Pilibacter termitis]SJZ51799.1 Bacteriocin (Lactococcin_972) [Pilibacter termitis]